MKGLVEDVFLVLGLSSHAFGKSLWSGQPVSNFSEIIKTAYPVGNGQLAALPFGSPGYDKLSLNRDTLWSGGPFENASYNGGNPDRSVASALPGIRSWIFQNGTGNVTALMGDDNNYGSYAVLGNLSVTIEGISTTSAYNRSLDLVTGVHTITYKTGKILYTTKVYCSYPDSVCVYDITSTGRLPALSLSFENQQSNASLVTSTCSSTSQSVSLNGTTRAGIGMAYKATAKLLRGTQKVSCTRTGGTMTVTPGLFQRSLTVVIAAGTNYDETKGTPAANYSFRGVDPGSYVAYTATKAASKSSQALFNAHIADYTALSSRFSLDLPDTAGSAGTETATLVGRYTANGTSDPYIESLQFDYGRHLFISSSRENSLPPNLQGKWAYGLSNAWGADYHANINLQMNHWGVEQTGLGDLQSALWTYMTDTWAPRGSETAKLLYNASGWVAHDEMNIFGHTGMKTGDEYWADYPASAAWMMLHVADHYWYSRDVTWLRSTGYPLLKPIAQFWLSQLQEDAYFHDGTLVVNPCSSPEHGATTFGCAHYQQLIHSLFSNALSFASILSDADTDFKSWLEAALPQLDKGAHIGNWSQLQEWKLDLDSPTDEHRHLSHLVGWYPGYSLSSYLSGYSSNTTLSSAVATSLRARGPGVADANAGWEKVWRSACWARLNNTLEAYYELRLTLQENMADNLLSMYSGHNEPFQIDANFGYVGAVLSMLVVDLPVEYGREEERTVLLGPAIPVAWAGGSVKGLRVMGGGVVSFGWDDEGMVTWARVQGGSAGVRIVNKKGVVLT